MLTEILIGGFGGQGIMLMGRLLAYGAIHENLEVTFFPSYGPEMRGGTANCTVVVSDRRIGSPIRNEFSVLMAMNQASLDKFTDRVKNGGMILYNQDLIENGPEGIGCRKIEIPANRLANVLGAPQVANMVCVGALAAGLGTISCKALSDGLQSVLPDYRHHLIPINKKAIRRGMEFILGSHPLEVSP